SVCALLVSLPAGTVVARTRDASAGGSTPAPASEARQATSTFARCQAAGGASQSTVGGGGSMLAPGAGEGALLPATSVAATLPLTAGPSADSVSGLATLVSRTPEPASAATNGTWTGVLFHPFWFGCGAAAPKLTVGAVLSSLIVSVASAE